MNDGAQRPEQPPESVVGVAWYDAGQWERLKQISSDGALLEETWLEWSANAEASVREMEAAGLIVNKVRVDVNALIDWCNQRGVSINGRTRAEYVSHRLQEVRKSDD